MKKKQFNIKVYDSSGTFLHTYSPDVIVNEPQFTSEMNSGFGQCRIILKKPFDDFDEGVNVNFENIIKIYEFDENNLSGRLIYSGVCTQYIPTAQLANQYVEMTIVGIVQFLSRAYFTSGGSYVVDYTGASAIDPAQMIKNVIDNLLVDYPNCGLSYSGGHIDNLGSTISHKFEEVKRKSAVDTAFGFMGAGWWWKVDESGQFWLKQKPTTATHTFEFTKHIDEAVVRKNDEAVINKIYFKYNGGNVSVNDATSILAYGKHEEIYDDQDITDSAGATNKANQILSDEKDIKISAKIAINSSYDIESIKVGDTCKILGLKKDSTLFSNNMQIRRINYKVDTVTIYLEEITDVFGTEISNFINNN